MNHFPIRYEKPLQQVILLLNNQITLTNETRQVLLTVQYVLEQVCERLTRVASTQNVTDIFTSSTPTLQNLASKINDIPRVIAVVFNSFVKEDLHRFLQDYQLGVLVRIFPAPFCGDPATTAALSKYFDLAGITSFVNDLCQFNMTLVQRDVGVEMMGLGQFMATNGGSSMLASLNASLTQAECIYNKAWTMPWMGIVDVSPVLEAINRTQNMDANRW